MEISLKLIYFAMANVLRRTSENISYRVMGFHSKKERDRFTKKFEEFKPVSHQGIHGEYVLIHPTVFGGYDSYIRWIE